MPSALTIQYIPYLPSISEVRCMVANVYREARGEPVEGQLAVARVVLNRTIMKEYPDTACGVIYQKHQFSWTSQYKDITYTMNEVNVVTKAYNEPDDFKATHYHNTNVHPSWRTKLKKGVTIGKHIFYYP